MTKSKKIFWSLAPLAAFSALTPILISASCGKKGRTIEGVDQLKGQRVWSAANADFSGDSFINDMSAIYGGFLGELREETGAYLLMARTFGVPKIETKKEDGKKYIIEPSYWKYSLEYADAVVVTKSDNTEEVFDKDDAELKQSAENPADQTKGTPAHYNFANYKATSNNERSINSKKFEEALKGAKKVQLRIRKDVKWIDAYGKQTKYNVVAEDFFISWIRTHTLSRGSRGNYLKGTTLENKVTELDKYETEMLSEGTKNFTDGLRYPNEYIYALFGIDSSKFSKKDDFISKKDGREFLNFHPLANKTDILSFKDLVDYFATAKDFLAAPSQYIKETLKEPRFTAKNGKRGEGAKASLLNALSQLPEDNLLRLAGVYTYGQNESELLYAGRYFSGGYYPEAQEYRYYKNRFHFDKDFVESETNVAMAVTKYYKTSRDIFIDQTFNEYRKGNSFRFSFKDLLSSQQADVRANPEEYGLTYQQSLNRSSGAFRLLTSVIPYAKGANDKATDMFLNEHAAKLFYGLSAEQVLNGTKDEETNEQLYENMLSGRSVSFRSLLSAAINWNAVANTLSSNNDRPWLANVAPHSSIGGTDQESNTKKRPIDYYEDLNTLYTVDENGNITNTIKPSDNANIATTATTTADKYKSAKFKEIQEAIKKILDEYQEKLSSEQKNGFKVEWIVPHRWANWRPGKMESVFSNVQSLIKSIDPRLVPTYRRYETTEKSQWINALFGGSIARIISWGYDVDSIGSGLDGVSNSGFLSVMLAIATNTKLENKLKTAFPTLVEASKKLLEFAKDTKNDYKFGFKLDDFNKIPTAYSFDLGEKLHHLKYDETDKKFVLDETANYTMSSSISAEFFISYVKKNTNETVIRLAKEIANYLGIQVDERKTISNENLEPTLVNKNYNVPFVADNNLWLADISVKK
ncbi:hypothetical protein NPA07_04240 [Mycoplasmopsis caviae]|uniref:Lipoprotein n=1 Tax=Mycoplasmopsis caviae TaxID=55603 RepID=A0A3P8KC62_9BACT|nr:hypothetical protein [Mycoplasmopsis caviae]UUD34991.1 hypothetical protein NPA07_04240 [Mycoplasmopsis caviae]VDR42184.1 Uncharacterised protein [Mycoplasmopsis caviae]